MTATFEQARDDIFSAFKAAWGVTTFPVVWPDKPAEKPSGRTPWARVTIRHAGGFQATLSNINGQRRWRRNGVVIVQVFTPSGEGLSRAYDLAKIACDAFEGVSTPRGVWFRNARINEVGPDGDWQQVNVLADFEYDEVK